MILVVSMSIGTPADEAVTAQYNAGIQPLLLKYGAERVSSARVLAEHAAESHELRPDEIHIMRFRNRVMFDAMRADPAYLALEPLRETALKHVRSYIAEEFVTFLD